MTFAFMLDTNIVSQFMRAPNGIVGQRARILGEGAACVSIVCAAELRFGATRVSSSRLAQQAEAAFEIFPVIPFQEPADRHYAEIRSYLQQRGELIGPTDLFIAAHARASDMTLVTANLDEFTRVPGLRVENWL
jgi:tRNA(fMet)-specific endonuclease VapC